MTQIAFIGLGNMGLGMAANLVKAGHSVSAFDRSEAALDKARAVGCLASDSLIEAVSIADYIVTMLPAGAHVRAVYMGDNGVLAHAKAGAMLMDCSTIDVSTSREVITQASEAGFDMVDAPVSGGVGGAAAGTLTFMCGGEGRAFARAKPLLDVMGKNIFHAGAAGNGQAAKICNNMLLGIHMIGTSEAFNLAEKLGLDAQTFYDISSTASGQNWSMTSYCPAPGPVASAPSNNDYKAGFAAAMMLKDLRLAQSAAQEAGADTPLGALSESIYAQMDEAGHGGMDFSAVIKRIAGYL
jgi:3-hydroxyisobutyrate dehydrogenase